MEDSNPSLACESCGASIPLTRVRRLGGYLRSVDCEYCGEVMTWSLAANGVVDLTEDVSSRDADGTAAPRPRDH